MINMISFALFIAASAINAKECFNAVKTIRTINKRFKRINMPGGAYPTEWLGIEYKTSLSFIFSSIYYLFTAILIIVKEISIDSRIMAAACITAALCLISQWVLHINYKSALKASYLMLDVGLYLSGIVYCVFSFVVFVLLA